ncbi:MAG: hypothetical protein HP492_09165 [Nitrospira sp.]|nr:hypothetical protein [Nitrospira sp.]
MSGLVFFLAGLTPHADQTLYPLFALLSVAIGGALALRVISTAGLFHLMALVNDLGSGLAIKQRKKMGTF